MTSQTPSLSFEVFPPNPAVGNEKSYVPLRICKDWLHTLSVLQLVITNIISKRRRFLWQIIFKMT